MLCANFERIEKNSYLDISSQLEFCGLDKVPHPHHQRVDWVPLSKKAIKVSVLFSPKFSCILNQRAWPSVSVGNSETLFIFLLKRVNIKDEKNEGIRDHGEWKGTSKQSFVFVLVLSGVAAACGPMFLSMQHFTISTLVLYINFSISTGDIIITDITFKEPLIQLESLWFLLVLQGLYLMANLALPPQHMDAFK